jgi:ankyrin repeat protein
MPASPTSDAGRREAELNEKLKTASKQLWTACFASRSHFECAIVMMKMEKYSKKQEEIKFQTSVKGFHTGPFATQVRTLEKPPGVQRALKAGADINWQNDEWDGATLLVRVIRSGELELMMWLLANGADFRIADHSGRGVLHWAAIEGSPAITEYLLAFSPEIEPMVNQGDNGSDCPLHLAAFCGHLPVVRLLIRAKADMEMVNGAGFTAAQLAEGARFWAVARYLSEPRQHEEDKEIPDEELKALPMLRRPCDLIEAQHVFNADCEMTGRFDQIKTVPGTRDNQGGEFLVRDEVIQDLHNLAKKLITPPSAMLSAT